MRARTGLFLQNHSSEERETVGILAKKYCEGDQDVCVFSKTGISDWGGEEPISFFTRLPTACLNNAVVSPRIRPFSTNFGQVFLCNLSQAVGEGNRIVVPCQNESNGRKKGYWTASWLTNALETSVQYHPEEAAAILSAPAKPRRRNSILQWYVQEAHLLWGQLQSLKTMDFNTRVVKGEYPFLRNAVNRVVSKPNSRFLEILEEESTYRNWMNYCIDGVYYKSALLQHMLERFFQTRQDLFVADMGAGPGYLAAELALCDERVREVLVNDSNGINLLFAKRFLAFFGEDFASRFSMNISPMEECRYERMYDVICFIGSLLYLPRDMAGITLDRAWDALLPGGILVVHENIKRDSYSRDYHLMFTTGELDDALARFGRILYFSSTAMMEVAPSRAGTSTVFRVVQKET